LPFFVVPAQAGIQLFQYFLDTGLRRYDGFSTFYDFIKLNMDISKHFFNTQKNSSRQCNIIIFLAMRIITASHVIRKSPIPVLLTR
jgi:hypothetical protein